MNNENIEDRLYCVYMHTSPSNKRYIGITSLNPKRRWKNGSGYNHNEYFTRAIEKYGWDNFKHEILEENLSLKEAYEKEQYYIQLYNTYDKDFGYNLTKGGDGVRGLKFSEDALKKLSEASKGENNPFYGRHHSEETKRKISEYFKGKYIGSLNPNYGNHWTDEQRSKASEYWTGNIISNDTRKKMSEAHKYRSEESYHKNSNGYKESQPHTKMTRCVELDIMFESFNEAARYFDVSPASISQSAHKGTKCKGYHFEIISNKEYIPKIDRPIVQLGLDNKFIKKYSNPKNASKELDISLKGILNALNGGQKTSGGYIWKFAEDYYNTETSKNKNIEKENI